MSIMIFLLTSPPIVDLLIHTTKLYEDFMTPSQKGKIRATFYIDKRLYQLLKRCSVIEDIPMSSIINDDILQERVGKYAHPTLDDWEGYLQFEASDKAREAEFEAQIDYYTNSPEARFHSAKAFINKQLEEKKISEDKAERLLKEAEKKFDSEIEEERKAQERKQKELRGRWLTAVKDYPIE